MKRQIILITCLIIEFVALPIKCDLKRGSVRCGQKTLLCPCGPMGQKKISINVNNCYTKTNTCEPCDRITDSVKCRIYEHYCNHNNSSSVPYMDSRATSSPTISNTEASCRCQNGGTCVNDSENTCVCLDEFEGLLCEIHSQIQTEPSLAIKCENPENPIAGYVVYENLPVIPGEYIRYMCSGGYELYGNVTRYCLETGQFSGVAPTCEKTCQIPSMNYNRLKYEINPRHKKENELINRFGNVKITEIEFSCQDNFQLEGPSLIRCSNGVWDKKPPSCVWHGPACTVPVISQMLIQEPEMKSGAVIPESMFQYKCKDNAVMVGDPIIVCSYSGTWVPKPPTCLYTDSNANDVTTASSTTKPSTSCSAPKTPVHGFVRLNVGIEALMKPQKLSEKSVLPVHTQVIYSCEEAYQLTTSQSIRTCLPDGRWNGRDPNCIPECGKVINQKSFNLVNGEPITIDKWPWQVGLYNYDNNVVFCGGSVLNDRWVLTAAHCVTKKMDDGSIQIVPYEKYGAFFGQTASQPGPSRKYVVKNKVWFATYHQDYNAVTGDSDIGLIYLETGLTFSNNIRPICLPDVKSNLSDITNSVGKVAGWGQTNQSADGNSVQLRFITVKMVSNDVCRQSTVHRIGNREPITDNMFCAQGEKIGSGTCHGDSGGSLCIETGPTDSPVYHIEGIVSFGSYAGCATPGQYDGYTKVRNFIDWIQSYVNLGSK